MFKFLKNKVFMAAVFVFYISIASLVSAQNYEPWTGAVVGARIDFSGNEALNTIRKLINKGDTIGAVREAEKLVTRLSQIERGGEETAFRYDAYNVLCLSLTANKEYEEAMKACNEAIRQYPTNWQAFNSRGSLNYKTENFNQALSDYKNALDFAPDAPQIIRILNHNIKLSEARINNN